MTTHDKPISKYGLKDLSDSPYYSIPASESTYLPRINFKLVSGGEVSLPYAYIGEISKDGGDITICENQKTVTVHGCHLDQLYRYLIQHRVAWIQESDSDFEEIEGKPFVTDISINQNQ